MFYNNNSEYDLSLDAQIQTLIKRANRRSKITLSAIIILSIATLSHIVYTQISQTNKYISPSRIEAKAIELDSKNEGLEQILTIDGKQYTLQEVDGKPTLVKYEKKE